MVAPSTRARVEQAIAQLEYRPNIAARSLSQRRTGLVHIVSAAPLLHGHAQTFVELVRALADRGYQTSTSRAPTSKTTSSQGLVPLGVDGVVLLGGHSFAPYWAEVANGSLPLVFVGGAESLPEQVSSVRVDQRTGGRLAGEHLLARGCTSLLHLCGPADWIDARERRDGFIKACEEAGARWRKLRCTSWEAGPAYEVAQSIPDDVDGVFASNDQIALGAMRMLHERGRRIPVDVAVVGFDDSMGADCYWPPLTTVRQPFRQLAETAVEHLTTLIESGEVHHTITKPELVVRQSTKGN